MRTLGWLFFALSAALGNRTAISHRYNTPRCPVVPPFPAPFHCHHYALITERSHYSALPIVPSSVTGWAWELKADGFRARTFCDPKSARILTRNGNDISAQFPEVIEALAAIGINAALDGELTIADDRGRPDWGSVRRRCVMKGPKAIAADAAARPATLYAFDTLAIGGRDVRPATFAARRAALMQLVPRSPQIRVPDLWDDGTALFRAVTELELEGVVGKRLDSRYTAGRTTSWLKVRGPTARPQQRR